MKNLFLSVIFLISVQLLVSCSQTKRIQREPLKEHGAEYLFNKLKESELNYNYLSVKFNATYEQDKNETKLSGQLRIKRDSVIWISISPTMGIELMRLMITNDSIWYMNRIENTYYSGKFDNLNRFINSTFDFDMLQSFLTGNDFSRYENATFREGIDNSEYTLVTSNRRKLKKFVKDNNINNIPIQYIWLNPENFKITRILVKEAEANGRKIEARYSHQDYAGQAVPNNISFNVETSAKKTSIKILYSKFSIDDKLQFPFKISDKYSRVELFNQ